MITFLRALGYHSPRLLDALRDRARARAVHALLPARHLGVVSGGCFEPLEGFREARARLNTAFHSAGVICLVKGVVVGLAEGVIFGGVPGLRVVASVGVVRTGCIHLHIDK